MFFDRLLRALPFLRPWLAEHIGHRQHRLFCLPFAARLSMGRWIFGSEQIAAAWPRATSRSFLLMSGAPLESMGRISIQKQEY